MPHRPDRSSVQLRLSLHGCEVFTSKLSIQEPRLEPHGRQKILPRNFQRQKDLRIPLVFAPSLFFSRLPSLVTLEHRTRLCPSAHQTRHLPNCAEEDVSEARLLLHRRICPAQLQPQFGRCYRLHHPIRFRPPNNLSRSQTTHPTSSLWLLAAYRAKASPQSSTSPLST